MKFKKKKSDDDKKVASHSVYQTRQQRADANYMPEDKLGRREDATYDVFQGLVKYYLVVDGLPGDLTLRYASVHCMHCCSEMLLPRTAQRCRACILCRTAQHSAEEHAYCAAQRWRS